MHGFLPSLELYDLCKASFHISIFLKVIPLLKPRFKIVIEYFLFLIFQLFEKSNSCKPYGLLPAIKILTVCGSRLESPSKVWLLWLLLWLFKSLEEIARTQTQNLPRWFHLHASQILIQHYSIVWIYVNYKLIKRRLVEEEIDLYPRQSIFLHCTDCQKTFWKHVQFAFGLKENAYIWFLYYIHLVIQLRTLNSANIYLVPLFQTLGSPITYASFPYYVR
jgi:hypothetical protein